jgi:hypothetical protein
MGDKINVKDKITWKDCTTWIVQVITILVVVISWFVVPFFTERQRKQAEIGIWQHTAMSDAHRNIATAMTGLHAYTTELASSYNCDIKDVLNKMNEKELNRTNRFLEQMNTELAIMYMIMPNDKTHEDIRSFDYLKKPSEKTTN